MSATLVQSVLGPSFTSSGTGGSPFTTTVAGSVAFPNPTTAGNLIIVVTANMQQKTGGSGTFNSIGGTSPTVQRSASLFHTFSPGNQVFYSDTFPTAGTSYGGFTLWSWVNASALSPATDVIQIHASNTASASLQWALQNEFAIFEFGNIDPTETIVHVLNSNFSSAGGTTDPGNATLASDQELLMVIGVGDRSLGSNVSAGSGFTLGPNMTVATIGQFQWQNAGNAGVYPAAFGGSMSTRWGAESFAIKTNTVSPPSGVWNNVTHVVVS